MESPAEGAGTNGFTLIVHGMIESAECVDAGLLYARTQLVKGPDWRITDRSTGEKSGTVDLVTQLAERLPGPVPRFTWNAPFELKLTSTNPSGWPQLALALTTLDPTMKDSVIGYARVHVPLRAGLTTVDLPLMRPEHQTPQFRLFGSLTGTPAELRDLSFLCHSDDRLVVNMVRSPGFVRVRFDVALIGFSALGYD
jgi:B9 domain-containing protein 1